jgi:uncharacterized protein YjbJ (UPF0337 family)
MTRTAGKAVGDQLVRLGPGRVHVNRSEETTMGDRLQRVKGKVEETKGKVRKNVSVGAGEELKGKTKSAAGRARSALKKHTR